MPSLPNWLRSGSPSVSNIRWCREKPPCWNARIPPLLSPTEFLEHLAQTPAGYRAAVTRMSQDPLPGLRSLRVAIAASFRADTLNDYLRVEGARRGFNLALWF